MKFILTLFQLTIFISCGSNANHKIKVAVSLPLSGVLSSFGQAELAGLQLALEENDKVELLVEDNKGDSKEAIIIAKRLTQI